MKVFANKFLIIGTLALLLVSIPLTLFLIKKQQDVRQHAAASSRLYFNPATYSTSTQCTSFSLDVMVDPGSNSVSIVDFFVKYDPTKVDITGIKESAAFPSVKQGSPIIGAGEAEMSVSIGGDITKSIQQNPAKVATITFKPKVAGPVEIDFDSTKSQILSTAPSDGPVENVLSTAPPANVTITSDVCPDNGPTPTGGAITPTLAPTGNLLPTVTPVPTTTSANSAPVCSGLTVAPSSSGAAPFAVLFTAQGNDPDSSGLITKASFSFGDGTTNQDVTTGLNLQTISTQVNHTYNTAGTFTASATLTDNNSALSAACSQTITVSGTGTPSATLAPTAIPTLVPTTIPTATPIPVKPTAVPTVPPTGTISNTLGVIGAVVLSIVGGFILLAL